MLSKNATKLITNEHSVSNFRVCLRPIKNNDAAKKYKEINVH